MSRTITWICCCVAASLTGWLMDKPASAVLDAIYFSGGGLFCHWFNNR